LELSGLIGEKVVDILISMESEPYGFDCADCCLVLENNVVIGIPFDLDGDVWIRNENDLTGKHINNSQITDLLRGTTIVGLLCYEDEDRVFIELDNGNIITEITIAPQGTGRAGLWVYDSLTALEENKGKEYTRLETRN